jgi:hypothetical protein
VITGFCKHLRSQIIIVSCANAAEFASPTQHVWHQFLVSEKGFLKNAAEHDGSGKPE